MDGMTTHYNHYPIQPMYDFPFMFTEWSSIVSNVYTAPIVPCGVISPQIIAPVFCPYAGVIVSDPIVPVVPTVAVDVTPVICNNVTPVICNNVTSVICNNVTPVICNNLYSHEYAPDFNCKKKSISTETLSDEVQYTEEEVGNHNIEEEEKESKVEEKCVNTIELYLRLPKELFPTPKMIAIDPNPIIDEFCKLASISEKVSWILDLEFGIPKVPVTRAIATYDVKFNSIHCKNTPGAIHPGFEKCDGDFKRVILFYYDCIVSNWYNGYIALNYDKSVENFQAWLQIPMQNLGMCWP